MIWLVLIVATVGSITAAICKGSGGASWAFSGNGSFHKQVITPRKPEGGVTCQTISSTFIGDVGSDFVL